MTESIDFIRAGLRVLDLELKAVDGLRAHVNDSFQAACTLMLACTGRIVVTGMGKSGHVGNKIAATLASTGSPAFFVHPGEASHGDLGMITGQDVVLALSNSGETSEVLTILPLIKRMHAKLISITGNPESTLAKMADVSLITGKPQEACPLGLAPTSSTTAQLVLGDALAVALLEARGFTAEDFALSHPGGSLGRRLLLRVEDLMHTGDTMPLVDEQTLVSHALLEMTTKGLGMTGVIDRGGRLRGIYTDGDLRRTLDHNLDVHSTIIKDVMTVNCKTVTAHILAAEALALMDEKRINGVMVVDADMHPVGALNMHDLLRAGVV